MSIEENQKNQLDLIIDAHGLDPVGHFFISESLRHIGDEALLPEVEFLIHYGGAGVEGHFNMWNPVFDQQKERFLSIFRGANDWWKFRDHHNVIPVAVASNRNPNGEASKLKAVLYPANYGSNHQWVQQNELQHIHIGHGDSNKSAAPIKFLDFMMRFGSLVRPTLNASKKRNSIFLELILRSSASRG